MMIRGESAGAGREGGQMETARGEKGGETALRGKGERRETRARGV